MGREIKFRGIRRETQEWIYGSLMNGDCDWEISDHNDITFGRYDVVADSVGQFTGLKDKNAIEIYEGDILKTAYEKLMVVGWSVKFASFIIQREGWAFSHYFGEACNPEDCVIIGNIYQNPELLNI